MKGSGRLSVNGSETRQASRKPAESFSDFRYDPLPEQASSHSMVMHCD